MTDQSHVQNRLLARLSHDDFALLSPHFESMRYKVGTVLFEPDEPIAFAYFLECGVASVVARSPEGLLAEAGVIGREGFIHPALVLGSDRVPLRVQIQLPDDAYRIPVAPFLQALDASATLRRTLLLFAHTYSTQSSFTTLSNTVHQVDERLARWLLMCHDRTDGDDLPLTHEFMGIMLSVRPAKRHQRAAPAGRQPLAAPGARHGHHPRQDRARSLRRRRLWQAGSRVPPAAGTALTGFRATISRHRAA